MARIWAYGNSIDHTPSSAVAVGAMVAIGTGMVGIADHAIAANELGALVVEGTAYVDKATGASTNHAVGTKLYLNTSTGKATASANDGGSPAVAYPPIGIVLVQPATADTEVLVKLSR